MNHRVVVLIACAVVGTGVLAGCSSATNGRGAVSATSRVTRSSPAPSTPPSSPTSSTPPRSTPAGTVTMSPSSSAAAGGELTARLCPGAPARGAPAQVRCLATSVGNYWSGELNTAVSEPVIVAPPASRVPSKCRPGLQLNTAFYCELDRKVYITAAFVSFIRTTFGDRMSYALASVVSHEIGHVVQGIVHQPGISGGENASKMIEQQADCLSGVWAAAQAAAGRLDPAVFRSVAVKLITAVSDHPEIYTHGTPAQRAAAIDRGLRGGRPQSCTLATFH